eukprot:2079430-Rhodomonas_salina.4
MKRGQGGSGVGENLEHDADGVGEGRHFRGDTKGLHLPRAPPLVISPSCSHGGSTTHHPLILIMILTRAEPRAGDCASAQDRRRFARKDETEQADRCASRTKHADSSD